jgi:serine/threonine protein kinase
MMDGFLMMFFFKKIAVMHDLHMIHTDLKPENILLVSSDYLKIPDYKVLLYEPVLFSHGFRHSMLMFRENVY